MLRYVIRRLLWAIVLFIAVTLVTYLIFFLIPVDPARLAAGKSATPADVKAVAHRLYLDRPIWKQYLHFLDQLVLHQSLGYSFNDRQSVNSSIYSAAPVTISLVLGGAIVWMLIAVPVGILSALRPRSRGDRASMGGALLLVSAPEYWLGLIVLYLFAADIGQVKIFPGSGSYVPLTEDPAKWFTSLLLPWFVVAAGNAAIYARLIRSSLIETMGQDYIRTARAKGLPERRVVLRHGVRAAINPILTILALDIGVLLGSAVLVETVFNIPGIGRLNYDAITHSDFPIVQGTILVAALFIVVANILVDIAYAYLDPRVRYS